MFEPGALFFLGDGHAVQGDGEIVGSGIEISMDVRFTVHVLKEKQIHWPRGENDDWIFTAGGVVLIIIGAYGMVLTAGLDPLGQAWLIWGQGLFNAC